MPFKIVSLRDWADESYCVDLISLKESTGNLGINPSSPLQGLEDVADSDEVVDTESSNVVLSFELSAPTHVELDEARLETFQKAVHSALTGAQSILHLTSNETRVVGHAPSTWFFLPAFFGCSGGWHINKGNVNKTVTSMRRVRESRCHRLPI